MNTIYNTQDVIDSRDIIERIEELESIEGEMDKEEHEELMILKSLAKQCQDYSDWEYGEILIHRDYFKTYMNEMVQDCYELPQDMPSFMSITLDYEMLEYDYASVYFYGQEYLIRDV